MPRELIRGHPRHSNVFKFAHFDIDINEASVMPLQYDMLIISRTRQPRAMAVMPESVISIDLVQEIVLVIRQE